MNPIAHKDNDKHGHEAPARLVGSLWQHTVNKKVYKITSVTWMGDTDEWGLIHHQVDPPVPLGHVDMNYTRSKVNFLGKLPDGTPRFEQLSNPLGRAMGSAG